MWLAISSCARTTSSCARSNRSTFVDSWLRFDTDEASDEYDCCVDEMADIDDVHEDICDWMRATCD